MYNIMHSTACKKKTNNLDDCLQSEFLSFFKSILNEATSASISMQVNLRDGIWPMSLCVCVCLLMCLCAGVCMCVSLICLALILAAIRTMPCIRKHAGVGLESRSGLENNVGTLLRPDFLLSLAMCYSTCPPRPQPGVTHHAYLGTHAWRVLACRFC